MNYSGKYLIDDIMKTFANAKEIIEKSYGDFENAPDQVLDTIDKMEELGDIYSMYEDSIRELLEDLEISNEKKELDKAIFRPATKEDLDKISKFVKDNSDKTTIIKIWEDAAARDMGICTDEIVMDEDPDRFTEKFGDFGSVYDNGGCVELVILEDKEQITVLFSEDGNIYVEKDGFNYLGLEQFEKKAFEKKDKSSVVKE